MPTDAGGRQKRALATLLPAVERYKVNKTNGFLFADVGKMSQIFFSRMRYFSTLRTYKEILFSLQLQIVTEFWKA